MKIVRVKSSGRIKKATKSEYANFSFPVFPGRNFFVLDEDRNRTEWHLGAFCLLWGSERDTTVIILFVEVAL